MAALTTETVIERLDDTDCQWDGCAGTLNRTTFGGDEAIVCETCGTPAVRFW